MMQAIQSAHIQNHMRPLDMRRDLYPVADLIEECFADTLDYDGRQYVQRMRKAAHNRDYMDWFSQSHQKGRIPAGFVWEEDGRLVGNLSLIPCTRSLFGFGEKEHLIANVAVREQYRRRGIAAALTRRAMDVLRSEGANPPWLHVRTENLAAYNLYRSLGFVERFRRTTWHSAPHGEIPTELLFGCVRPGEQVDIAPRRNQDWSRQKLWFEHAYPPDIVWHTRMDSALFQPGLWALFYRSLGDVYLRQWGATKDGRLLGFVIWQPTPNYADNLWLAVNPDYQDEAVQCLLVHLRGRLDVSRPLALDYPEGWSNQAITSSGFHIHTTLVWMHAKTV